MNLDQQRFEQGQVIRQPVGTGGGYWAGAPGAYYDESDGTFYVTYRVRRPRGIEPDRGGEARILRSSDLLEFEDIWYVRKDAYRSASIERSALRRGPDGLWRYYTSYVDPSDGRWCVAVTRAEDVEKLQPSRMERLFSAGPLGLEGIKDPAIFNWEGRYYMYLSVALRTGKTSGESHQSADIYNTGDCLSATGLAVSSDLDHWEWQGTVFGPDESGWDKYCRRINSVTRAEGKFYGFYDGSASHLENYEEKTGLAVSEDLRNWRSVSLEQPFLTSPHGSGSLRYMEAIQARGKLYLFHEYAREDGGHDLRVLETEMAGN